MTACKNSESSDSKDSNSDSKLDIYLSSDGTPYYLDSDGSEVYLSTTTATEDSDDDSDSTDSYIYGNYDSNGLKFDIPDGWYVDESFGSPTIFEVTDDGNPNYDEYITLMPTSSILGSDVTSVDKSTIEDYFTELVDAGYYTEFTTTDSGEYTVAGYDADYYDITVSYTLEDGGDTYSFRGRYIFTQGDNSYSIMLTSLDDDDSFTKVEDLYNEFVTTLTLPTADEIAAAEEESSVDLDTDDAEEIDLSDLEDLIVEDEDTTEDESADDTADSESAEDTDSTETTEDSES
jgi:hypothetical protein